VAHTSGAEGWGPGIVACHPFRKVCGKDGAPALVGDNQSTPRHATRGSDHGAVAALISLRLIVAQVVPVISVTLRRFVAC